MQIEVWFDFICPYSYVGKKHFDEALENFKYKNKVEVVYKSFCVTPYIKETLVENVHSALARHKEISYEDAKKINETLKNKFPEFNFNFDNVVVTSSRKAHQIMHMITSSELQSIFIDHVFKAHFVDGLDISSLEVLQKIASYIGLDKEDVKAVYLTEMFLEEIHDNAFEMEEFNLKGIPAFLVDRKFYLPGAHPVSAFSEMLTSFYNESKKQVVFDFCDGDEDCQ